MAERPVVRKLLLRDIEKGLKALGWLIEDDRHKRFIDDSALKVLFFELENAKKEVDKEIELEQGKMND